MLREPPKKKQVSSTAFSELLPEEVSVDYAEILGVARMQDESISFLMQNNILPKLLEEKQTYVGKLKLRSKRFLVDHIDIIDIAGPANPDQSPDQDRLLNPVADRNQAELNIVEEEHKEL